jgi:hypothetical protein
MQGSERRRCPRHPIRVPIAIREQRQQNEELRSRIADLAEGGLCFVSPRPFQPGDALEVSLPVGDRRFTLVGTVVRCTPSEAGEFAVGMMFLSPEMSFRVKLAEQVLRIEELRLELSRERGAEVSREEAAERWVERHARDFAELYAA